METTDKATTKEIESRFDNDVETFSNLDTGQSALMDAPLLLEVTAEAAKRIVPDARHMLDVGCGAGNYTMMMLRKIPNLNCTLVDLSGRMLEKAEKRVSEATSGKITVVHGDIRSVELPDRSFDIILAGAVLHHLRDDWDWEKTFAKLYTALKPGGCFVISDLVLQNVPVLEAYSRERFSEHLENVGGKAYRDDHLQAVEREDTPRSLTYQLALMKRVGFNQVDILHKNACFASFCGIK